MKTVKFLYGSTMNNEFEIYETDATLSDLLELGFALIKTHYVFDYKTYTDIFDNFRERFKLKYICGSEDFIGPVRSKTDFEIDLDDFNSILKKYDK